MLERRCLFATEVNRLTSEQLVKQRGHRRGAGDADMEKERLLLFNQSLHKCTNSLTSHLLHA